MLNFSEEELYEIKYKMKNMTDEKISDIMQNVELIKDLGLKKHEIAEFLERIPDDDVKLRLIGEYKIEDFHKFFIIRTCTSSKKRELLLDDKIQFRKWDIVSMINSFTVQEIIEFIENEKEYLFSNNIAPYEMFERLDIQKKFEFIYQIDDIDLPEDEKRRIIACGDNKFKSELDRTKINGKYLNLLDIKILEKNLDSIIPDLNGDLLQYKDLDGLLYINPLDYMNEENYIEKLIRLCEICPDVQIRDDFGFTSSTAQEFIEAEEWIAQVLDGIKPDWSDVQKMAYIDNCIGKKISYSPDFGTEVEKPEDERSLWKIISKGYGVCNGITQIEQYMLKRVGIESERVSSKKHAFLKVNDIEIPTENGKKKGNTLVDPTWNLADSRYGARPMHFCKSYQELRKEDIDDDGKDHESHYNEKLETEETIEMDDKNLREVYKSIGLADENGKFPIVKLLANIEQIEQSSQNPYENIENKLDIIKEYCPQFAQCINSTTSILETVFSNNNTIQYNRCIAKRVYEKNDPDRKAVLFVYFDLGERGKRFYYADRTAQDFIGLSQEEFEERFECYDKDLEANGNKRFWESNTIQEEKKENSSGNIIGSGDER